MRVTRRDWRSGDAGQTDLATREREKKNLGTNLTPERGKLQVNIVGASLLLLGERVTVGRNSGMSAKWVCTHAHDDCAFLREILREDILIGVPFHVKLS